jgi:uncharacterized protein YbjT (DUF2867 family)
MTHSPILVAGAAGGSQGSTGFHVTRLLVENGVPVRALVHHKDERLRALENLGVDIVEGDLRDLKSMRPLFRGIKRTYFTYPVRDGLLEATSVFAAAAREAGVETVVNLSQLSPSPDAPTPRMREHWISEQILDWAGVGAVHLRATVFFENVRALIAGTAPHGIIYLPWGDENTRIPLVGAEDVARIAANLLIKSYGHEPQVRLIGQVPTVRDILGDLSKAYHREVKYIAIGDEDWRRAAAERGVNPHALAHLSQLWTFFRASNRSGGPAYEVTDTIERISGAKPTTFSEFLKDSMQDSTAVKRQLDAISTGA